MKKVKAFVSWTFNRPKISSILLCYCVAVFFGCEFLYRFFMQNLFDSMSLVFSLIGFLIFLIDLYVFFIKDGGLHKTLFRVCKLLCVNGIITKLPLTQNNEKFTTKNNLL